MTTWGSSWILPDYAPHIRECMLSPNLSQKDDLCSHDLDQSPEFSCWDEILLPTGLPVNQPHNALVDYTGPSCPLVPIPTKATLYQTCIHMNVSTYTHTDT